MDKIYQFLDSHIEVAMATVGDGKPHIRIFQVMKRVNGTLFFATAARKRVYAELQANPHIEVMASSGNVFVRMAGTAVFDVDDATQRAIYDANPVLQRLYDGYTSLVYFRLKADEAQYYDLTPTPPVDEYYDLRDPHRPA